jgi:hypothetical protein
LNLSQSKDGKVLAMGVRSLFYTQAVLRTWVLHADPPDSRLRLETEKGTAYVAVSPDGRHVATANWFADTVKVLDAHNGQLVRRSSKAEAFAFVSSVPTASGWPLAWTAVACGRWTWNPGRKGSNSDPEAW